MFFWFCLVCIAIPHNIWSKKNALFLRYHISHFWSSLETFSLPFAFCWLFCYFLKICFGLPQTKICRPNCSIVLHDFFSNCPWEITSQDSHFRYQIIYNGVPVSMTNCASKNEIRPLSHWINKTKTTIYCNNVFSDKLWLKMSIPTYRFAVVFCAVKLLPIIAMEILVAMVTIIWLTKYFRFWNIFTQIANTTNVMKIPFLVAEIYPLPPSVNQHVHDHYCWNRISNSVKIVRVQGSVVTQSWVGYGVSCWD